MIDSIYHTDRRVTSQKLKRIVVYKENGIGNGVIFYLSFTFLMHIVTGRAMLPYSTVNMFYCLPNADIMF